MKTLSLKAVSITLAAPVLAMAAPALAAAPQVSTNANAAATHNVAPASVIAEHHRGKHRGWKRGRGNPHRYTGGYGYRDRDYGQPVYRDTRIWRGRDGRYYCRKENGTTGLLIGAAVGGLIGNEIAGRGDKTLGAILGAAGGAILGRSIDRSNSRCR